MLPALGILLSLRCVALLYVLVILFNMILALNHKKLFVAVVFVTFFGVAKSQLRTDGYYLNTNVSKTGDTTFHVLIFGGNNIYTDTSGNGMAPAIRQGQIVRSNTSYLVNNDGKNMIVTYTPTNMGRYDVSNCPCKNKIRMESDGGIFVLAWKENKRNWKNINQKYLFVPFGS